VSVKTAVRRTTIPALFKKRIAVVAQFRAHAID